MLMSYVWTGMLALSILSAVLLGNGSALSTGVTQGAQSAITLTLSLAGSLCLWCAIGRVLSETGVTGILSRLLRPVIVRVFPSCRKDARLAESLSANICANFLGLGNAATPMGIQAAQRLAAHTADGIANNELCRLVVLNTASIQFIPANVAAVRSALGCETPFDILPAVWLTSLCSAGLGLLAAWGLEKIWRY